MNEKNNEKIVDLLADAVKRNVFSVVGKDVSVRFESTGTKMGAGVFAGVLNSTTSSIGGGREAAAAEQNGRFIPY